jgi:hypothetical protein
MWHLVLKLCRSAFARPRPQAPRRRGLRLRLEKLEDRMTPSSFNSATVSDLIADINAANRQGGANTIALTAPTTTPYNLTAVDNTTNGATGLPVITPGDNLTILGNGDTLARSAGAPAFRLLDVVSGASLTLASLMLQGGLAFGSAASAEGGTLYNQGALTLNGVTVQNNIAQGNGGASHAGLQPAQAGQNAAGGGIYSSGSLTLEGASLIQNNQALGGHGSYNYAGPGGNAFGGGVYVAAGTVNMTDATLSSNVAQGDNGGFSFYFSFFRSAGGAGGNGFGGGLYVSSGSVSMNKVTMSSNTVQGRQGGAGGYGGGYTYYSGGAGGDGFGGGLYAAGGSVRLQSDTVTGNAANGGLGGSKFPSGISGL